MTTSSSKNSHREKSRRSSVNNNPAARVQRVDSAGPGNKMERSEVPQLPSQGKEPGEILK